MGDKSDSALVNGAPPHLTHQTHQAPYHLYMKQGPPLVNGQSSLVNQHPSPYMTNHNPSPAQMSRPPSLHHSNTTYPSSVNPSLHHPNFTGPSLPHPSSTGPGLSYHTSTGSSLPHPSSTGPALSYHTSTGSSLPHPSSTGPGLSYHTSTGSSLPHPSSTGPALSYHTSTGSSLPRPSSTGPSMSHSTSTGLSLPHSNAIGSTFSHPHSTNSFMSNPHSTHSAGPSLPQLQPNIPTSVAGHMERGQQKLYQPQLASGPSQPAFGPPRQHLPQAGVPPPNLGPPRPHLPQAGVPPPNLGPSRPQQPQAGLPPPNLGPSRPQQPLAGFPQPNLGPSRPQQPQAGVPPPILGPPRPHLPQAGVPPPNLGPSRPQQPQAGLPPHTGIPQGYQPFPPMQKYPPSLSNTVTNQNQTMMPPQFQSAQYQNQITPNHMGAQPPPVNNQPAGNAGYPSNSNLSSSPPNQRFPGMANITQGMNNMSVTQQGFNKLWGVDAVDLLQCRNVLPPTRVEPPPIKLGQEFFNSVNCAPEIFCCTLNKIPETSNLLQKSRLPLGVLIHPFRDLNQLPVIQCSSIVRCRVCRTYINPFVYFVDNKRWKCNLCFRVNELPEEFRYDPVSKTCGDPSRRPEIKSSTIEFIAPSEYMLRPPQPAMYLFVLDVSRNACDSGYLSTLCATLLEELNNLPGDSRTQIGFILYDSYVHFYSIADNFSQAHEMIVTDIDDIFLPAPDSLLVNLRENQQLIRNLLEDLPNRYTESFDTDSALGPALQAAYKLMSPTGGRVTVFQSCLPNKGPGLLAPREDPNQRSSNDVNHLGPQTDFYKRLSLDCSTQQISVDLFLLNSQYADLATLGGVSQFSGGCIYHFPMYRRHNVESNERLIRSLRRYLTRKIGFEAVMRVRCSRGLSIHTFHGNFFVRSTDLLSLPNINPDAGFGMQVSIEDSLSELQTVCFQAAVLYTSAKGERRIRVHTMCLPVSSNLFDILNAADQQAIVGLLSKMAVDRSLKSSLSDAREAFINAAIDIMSAYKLVETSGGPNSILAPLNLALIPLYILCLLKSTAFRTGSSTRLDDRVFAMVQLKTLPLRELIQLIHVDLYDVTQLNDETNVLFDDKPVAQPARLTLSSEHLDSRGVFVIDTPDVIYLVIGRSAPAAVVSNYVESVDQQHLAELVDLPLLDNEESEKLRYFVSFLQSEKPAPVVVRVLTEPKLIGHYLVNDKTESTLSYYELLQHIKAQMK